MQRSTTLPRTRQLEKGIPLVLRPVLRAYVLGYASSTVPRLLTLLLTHLSRRRKNIDLKPSESFVYSFIRILNGGLEFQRFPTFCAALVGGSTLIEARDHGLFRFSLLIRSIDTLTEAHCAFSRGIVASSAIEVSFLASSSSSDLL